MSIEYNVCSPAAYLTFTLIYLQSARENDHIIQHYLLIISSTALLIL